MGCVVQRPERGLALRQDAHERFVRHHIGKAEYTYSGFRNRVKKLESFHNPQAPAQVRDAAIEANIPNPTKELRYVLDMTLPYDNLLMTQGAHNQSFTWGNGLLSGSNNGEAANADDATNPVNFYYLQDHLGSPIRLVSEDGNGYDSITAYDEFGVPEVATGNPKDFHNPFGFTGYQLDDISGLHFAQARFYNPTTGQFGAEDPAKDQLNWYGYCGGNPINFVDPSGLSFACNMCQLNPCECGQTLVQDGQNVEIPTGPLPPRPNPPNPPVPNNGGNGPPPRNPDFQMPGGIDFVPPDALNTIMEEAPPLPPPPPNVGNVAPPGNGGMDFEMFGDGFVSPGALGAPASPAALGADVAGAGFDWSNAFSSAQDFGLRLSMAAIQSITPIMVVTNAVQLNYRIISTVGQLTYSDDQERALTQRVANYRGQIVVRIGPMGNSAISLGPVMGIGGGIRPDGGGIDLLRHEHGHFLEYQELGFLMYYLGIGLPSIVNFNRPHDWDFIINLPFERHADWLAGVELDDHTEDSLALAILYFQHLQSISGLSGENGLFRFLATDLWDFVNLYFCAITGCECD